MTENFVWNGRIPKGYSDHLAASHFPAFANGIRHFAGFPEANADSAFFVAHNYERAKIESSPTLHHFGGTIDKHHFLDQFLALFAIMHFFRPSASSEAPAPALSASATTTEISFRPMFTARFRFGGGLWFGSYRCRLLGSRAGRCGGGLLGFFWLGWF